MPAQARNTYSEQEYLAFERAAETKSEFINGVIYAMARAGRDHIIITGNVSAELRAQLRGRSCNAYISNMRVKVNAARLYTYPDVVVACGEARFEDEHVDTLLDPTVIVEVLSPSTEAYDRGAKFAHYQRSESLTDYVLVSQDRCRVEHFSREGDRWIYRSIDDPAGRLELASIGCVLPLGEIYLDVTFPPVESPETPNPDAV